MLATIVLFMAARLNKVLVLGPTNVAITNAAERIYAVSSRVIGRLNKGKPIDQPNYPRHVVIRAYNIKVELEAFRHILQHPGDVKNAGVSRYDFQLPLSRAFWLLVLFGATDIGRLDDEDSLALHDVKKTLEHPVFEPVRERLSSKISWDEYLDREDKKSTSAEGTCRDNVENAIKYLVGIADIICTTPACSENDLDVRNWRTDTAKGLVVDEAGNMNRADLAGVWGNCLLPCFLVGDAKQLPPTVMSNREKDEDGFLFNPFSNDGHLSPLEMFQGSGIPVYQLHVQLRMPPAMFDAVGREFYPEIPFTYGKMCTTDRAEFQPGRLLEKYAQSRFAMLTPARTGTFSPFFMHCERSVVYRSEMNSSRRCPGQVNVALGFAKDFVEATGVDPAGITILSPYAANVEFAERRRQQSYADALSRMQPVSTIDGFQGQENDIVIAIMGTNEMLGAGFTAQTQRLNVLLTRARCGLVLVGDLDAVRKRRSKLNRRASQKEIAPDGSEIFINIGSLYNIYEGLKSAGRVVTIPKNAQSRKGEADEGTLGEVGKKRKDGGGTGGGASAAKKAREREDSGSEEGQVKETAAGPSSTKKQREREKKKQREKERKERRKAEVEATKAAKKSGGPTMTTEKGKGKEVAREEKDEEEKKGEEVDVGMEEDLFEDAKEPEKQEEKEETEEASNWDSSLMADMPGMGGDMMDLDE